MQSKKNKPLAFHSVELNYCSILKIFIQHISAYYISFCPKNIWPIPTDRPTFWIFFLQNFCGAAFFFFFFWAGGGIFFWTKNWIWLPSVRCFQKKTRSRGLVIVDPINLINVIMKLWNGSYQTPPPPLRGGSFCSIFLSEAPTWLTKVISRTCQKIMKKYLKKNIKSKNCLTKHFRRGGGGNPP